MSGSETTHSGLTRRSFLKTAGALSGVGLLGGAMTIAANAAEPVSGKSNEEIFVGRCTNFGGCFGCEREVVVREGKVVNTRPKKDAPYGRRPCARGYGQVRRIYSQERLKYPLKRVEGTERGSGEWERISWDEAISLISEKWQNYLSEVGPHSIAIAMASGNDSLGSSSIVKLGHMLEAVSVDPMYDMAVKFGQWQVAGKPLVGNLNPGNEPFEEDVFNAKNVIVWGANISEVYNQRWRKVLEAQDLGLNVVVIDPNQTLAAQRANAWYKIRPGSDPALLLGMMKIVIEEDRHDVSFLKEQTVAPLLVRKEDGMFLRMSHLGIEPTEGPANPLTGQPTMVDPLVVWDAAEGSIKELDQASDPVIEGDFSIQGIEVETAFDVFKRHLADYSVERVSELTDLSPEEITQLADLATDGPVTHLTGLGWQMYSNSWATGAGLSSLLAVTGQVLKPGAGMVPANAMAPTNAAALMKAGTFMTATYYEALPDILDSGSFNGVEMPLKSLLISGTGFVGGACEERIALERILPKLEFVVCIDVVMTDSARYADLVLPDAHIFEKETFFGSPMEREIMYSPKMTEPAYEAKPTYEITQLIGEAMGFGQFYEETLDEFIEANQLDVEVVKKAGITLEKLRENPTQRWHEKGFLLHDGEWTTPTKRMEFYAESPAPRYPFREGEFHVEDYRMCTFTEPQEAWPGTEAQKKYPYILYSVRSHFRWHSNGYDDSVFLEIEPEPIARINPSDAFEKGIQDGDYVEYFSDRGHAVARTYLDAAIRPGMICYPKGYQGWQYKAGNFSELSPGYVDPFAVSAIYYDATVDMRKWEG